ncbi:hypothetical protein AAG747_15285 [Rapidithrix thailandica]|uniref:Uncharacterized protein n=1 Tax=Rapidithrix thailandica TaxID=413964 RepID=A0AAW9S8E5_9BACT
MENSQIIVQPNENGEVIIRKGEAAPAVDNRHIPIKIKANILAPFEFWSKRNHLYSKDRVRVDYCIHTRNITLVANEHSQYSDLISGSLSINPDLEGLGIGQKQMSPNEMAKFLKTKRHLFRDQDAHKNIISELSNLKAKIEAEIEACRDDRGNKTNSIRKQVSSNVPIEFVLCMPIFVGFEKKEFKVEVCLDSTDSSVTCWMESIEMIEILEKEKRDIILGQVEQFKQEEIACIEH